MMQWVDFYAAPALVLLLIAAAGGFFVHQGLRLPVDYVRGDVTWRTMHTCWVVGGIAALAMAWMVWNMAHGGTGACTVCMDWQGVDGAVATWVQDQAHTAWLSAVAVFTQLGHIGWMATMGAVASLWLLYRRAWLLLGAWVVGVAGVGLSVRLIKHSVARERPEVRWVLEQGFSFPSGHSAGTLVCYGLLTWLWLRMAQSASGRMVVVCGAALVVLGVGLSRVLLGAHHLSDVLAGWLLGLVWLAGVIGTAEAACRCTRRP